ncbi:hypothetical protein GC174_01825 [bacterium]|nr:hypothetical protein [bacterium]
MKKYFIPLLIAAIYASVPVFAQSSDGYDMTNFKAGAESFGVSEFRITPDMYPEHSYHRMVLMKQYGPRGKPVGFSTVSGKAFDYLNSETLKTKRYQPKESDPYLDAAYSAPKVDGNYDPAYHSSGPGQSFGASELKPLGPNSNSSSKHNADGSPFSGVGDASRLFSTGSARPFNSSSGYSKQLDSAPGDVRNPSEDERVFDGESMF